MRHAYQPDMKLINRILTVLLIATLTFCTTNKYVSTIESDKYDDNIDQTIFTKFPLGTVTIPGKWTKISYNQVSGQHHFMNVDSAMTAIAINQASSYPFYKPKMTPNTIVQEFYEWDSKYLAEKIKGERSVIKRDTTNHFIIWQITADTEKRKIDTYYLFGSENGIVFTILGPTKKWTNEQKVIFLETVYKNKTVGNCCK